MIRVNILTMDGCWMVVDWIYKWVSSAKRYIDIQYFGHSENELKFNCKTNIRRRRQKGKTKKILHRWNNRGEKFKEQKAIYSMKWFIDVMETRMIWNGRKAWKGRMNSVGYTLFSLIHTFNLFGLLFVAFLPPPPFCIALLTWKGNTVLTMYM